MDPRRSFVIGMPDTEQAATLAARVLDFANVVFTHPSGRPWLAGSLPEDSVVHYADGQLAVAVIGRTSLNDEALAQRVRGVRRIDDLGALGRAFPGSYLVFGTLDGELFASGPAVPTRQLFTAAVDGVSLVADRADLLAMLGNFPLDRIDLALSLARGLPHPLDQRPLWDGVESVPPGSFTVVNAESGHTRRQTWWRRPEPELSRHEGAHLLADSLREAVAARVEGRGRIASDLSGGLDSTPITYFAAHAHDNVLARTFYTEDPGGREDLEWAERALPMMPGVTEHFTFSTAGVPEFYQGLDQVAVPFDHPTQAATSVPRVAFMLRDDRHRGIGMHVNGLGGDHLFRGVRAWDHTLARRRPLLAWRRARAEGIPLGEPPHRTLQHLMDCRNYQTWLEDDLQETLRRGAGNGIPTLNDWSVPLGLPSWLSTSTRQGALERVRDAAAGAEPLGETLAEHFDLYTLRQAGYLTRSMMMTGQAHGVDYESPLLDDRVVEAVLSVRHEERDTPTEWKPLMKEAMDGLLPQDYLRRTNKIGAGPQPVRGYAAHFQTLKRIWEDSGLLDSGLFDTAALLEAAEPKPTAPPSGYFHALTDSAVFLRTWNMTRDELSKAPRRSHEIV